MAASGSSPSRIAGAARRDARRPTPRSTPDSAASCRSRTCQIGVCSGGVALRTGATGAEHEQESAMKGTLFSDAESSRSREGVV